MIPTIYSDLFFTMPHAGGLSCRLFYYSMMYGQKGIQVKRPNQAWVSDITYIRTFEGWLYLCIIMDLYSRNIVGWSMEDRLTKELVIKSLDMVYSNEGHICRLFSDPYFN